MAVDLPPVGDLAELLGRDVEGLADHVEHVAEDLVAHRHGDAGAGVAHRGAAAQAVGGLEADGPDPVVADLLGDLGADLDWLAVDARPSWRGVLISGRASRRELDVDHRAGDR